LKLRDDRVWLPDMNNVMDWEAVKKAVQVEYDEKPLATWWTQATPGVNYYRADLPARHLPGKTVRLDTWDLQEVTSDGGPAFDFPSQEGSAVWMFPGNTAKALLMAEMKLQGLPVYVEVDDNYTVDTPISGISEWKPTMKQAREAGTHVSYEEHRLIVKHIAEGVICSTPFLAEQYSRLNENVHVCPNAIDPDDWEEPVHQRDGVLRIGWAGSTSHVHDLNEIVPALSWASQQKDVEVVILGKLEIPVPCTHVPWADSLATYRENMQNLDVILCPLRPGLWADGKSDVKALEGVMGGALPVVSKTEPYRPWWDRGYVAETKKDWVKIVKHLVKNRDEVQKCYQDARHYVLTERTIQTGIEKWRSVLL
jgi:hypothetical protein